MAGSGRASPPMFALTGGVRRQGDRVRIAVSLADTATGVQVWADRYDPAASGTVIRSDTVRELARAAGFDRVDVVPVNAGFFRPYRLSAQ